MILFSNNNNKAFTLIELLIVIAIIGLLSSIVIASLNSARGKANNSRRLFDIKQIKTAVNSYANDFGGTYPAGVGCIGAASGTKCWPGYTLNAGAGTGVNANPTLDASLLPYINVTALTDPKSTRTVGDRYVYFNGGADPHCNGTTINGPFVAFVPEVPATENSCTALGATYACCSMLGCAAQSFCIVPLN